MSRFRFMSPTPWGDAQTTEELPGPDRGLYVVTTTGHGGVFVPTEHLHRIPEHHQAYAERWSRSRQWYEEDIAVVAVIIAFPLAFPRITAEDREKMRATLERYATRPTRRTPREEVTR